MTTPTPIPLSIRAYKYLGYLSLLIAGIGLIFGIASLFNDPIKNIKEYSPGSSEKLSFVTKATKIQDFTFFKVVSSGRRSTNTLKYHRINTGKYEFILEFNSDNGNPEYSKKIYLDNDIKASAGDIETLSTETKLPIILKVYRYTTEDNIKTSNGVGFLFFGGGLLGFAIFQFRYWYYIKSLNEHIEYASQNISKDEKKVSAKPEDAKFISESPIQVEQINKKGNKYVFSALAFFLGTFGIHKFYIGKVALGLTYLAWLPLLIIGISLTNGILGIFAFIYLFVIGIISIIEVIVSLISKW